MLLVCFVLFFCELFLFEGFFFVEVDHLIILLQLLFHLQPLFLENLHRELMEFVFNAWQ